MREANGHKLLSPSPFFCWGVFVVFFIASTVPEEYGFKLGSLTAKAEHIL